MDDYLENFVEINSPELEEKSILEEIFIKDELIIKEDVNANWNKTNHDYKERLSEFLNFPNVEDSKPISISLEDTILEDFQQDSYQSQFLNITEANLLNLSERLACPNCGGLFMGRENLATHLQFCKPIIEYPCNKCPFVTSKESLLTHHTETTHVPKKCPKCEVLCENQRSFLFHYQSCQSKDDILYCCKKCTYQCREISMMNFHTKLMHSSGQVVINIEKGNVPQKKCMNLTFQKEIPEKKGFSTKFPNTEDYNGKVEQDDIANSLLSQDQRNSIEKDYFEGDRKIIAKIDHSHNNNKTSNAAITKVCRVCNIIITTKVTATDKCNTCKTISMFRCNQCNRYFENYQKVSLHLWTECLCHESNFHLPHKLHCNKYHPNSVSLGSNDKTECVKYNAIESNTQKTNNPDGNGQKANAGSGFTESSQHVKNDHNMGEIRKFAQFIVWHCPKCIKDAKLESSNVDSYLQSCKDCNTSMWWKCAKCKKGYKKWFEYFLNHLKTICYRQELLGY